MWEASFAEGGLDWYLATPASVESSKLLETVGCGGLCVEVLHSLPIGVEVVALDADALGASSPIPGALFAKKKRSFVTFSPASRLMILDLAILLGVF
jgi:hypothetical protein